MILAKRPRSGSPGLVVMGGDSCSKGCGFKSQRHILRILDGHYSYLFIINCNVCLKRWKEAGSAHLKIIIENNVVFHLKVKFVWISVLWSILFTISKMLEPMWQKVIVTLWFCDDQPQILFHLWLYLAIKEVVVAQSAEWCYWQQRSSVRIQSSA